MGIGTVEGANETRKGADGTRDWTNVASIDNAGESTRSDEQSERTLNQCPIRGPIDDPTRMDPVIHEGRTLAGLFTACVVKYSGL